MAEKTISTSVLRRARRPAPTAPAARPRGAARREALLEAVLRIVADTGADAVTHRRVAEIAGLPLAATTYWFDSKEHLLTAALELAAQRDTARLLARAAQLSEDRGGPSSIDAAVAVIAEPLDRDPQASRGSLMATYALLLEAARRPALQDVAQRWTEVYLLTLGQLLERAGSGHPRQDAELLLGAADGLLIGSWRRARPATCARPCDDSRSLCWRPHVGAPQTPVLTVRRGGRARARNRRADPHPADVRGLAVLGGDAGAAPLRPRVRRLKSRGRPAGGRLPGRDASGRARRGLDRHPRRRAPHDPRRPVRVRGGDHGFRLRREHRHP